MRLDLWDLRIVRCRTFDPFLEKTEKKKVKARADDGIMVGYHD